MIVLKIAAGILLAWVIWVVTVFIFGTFLLSASTNKVNKLQEQYNIETNIPTREVNLNTVTDFVEQLVPPQDAMQNINEDTNQTIQSYQEAAERARIKTEFCRQIVDNFKRFECTWKDGEYERMQTATNPTQSN
jgi:preprotein translocase subunit SecF